MEADKAVEDAYLDLQSHQVATLRAIPGALRATLDRFSPGSIRRRAENIGLLARILPGARDAALWRNYEREFVAVKKESDEAFMEVFAKEFRKAYERQLREDGLNRAVAFIEPPARIADAPASRRTGRSASGCAVRPIRTRPSRRASRWRWRRCGTGRCQSGPRASDVGRRAAPASNGPRPVTSIRPDQPIGWSRSMFSR